MEKGKNSKLEDTKFRSESAKTKRVEINIETDQVFVLKDSRVANIAWCKGCNKAVVMLTPEQVAIIKNVSSQAVYRWVDAGEIHYAVTSEGLLLVCLNSLV